MKPKKNNKIIIDTFFFVHTKKSPPPWKISRSATYCSKLYYIYIGLYKITVYRKLLLDQPPLPKNSCVHYCPNYIDNI